jgi:hypothetical protein
MIISLEYTHMSHHCLVYGDQISDNRLVVLEVVKRMNIRLNILEWTSIYTEEILCKLVQADGPLFSLFIKKIFIS